MKIEPTINSNVKQYGYKVEVCKELHTTHDREYQDLLIEVTRIKVLYAKFLNWSLSTNTLNQMLTEFRNREYLTILIGLDKYSSYTEIYHKMFEITRQLKNLEKFRDKVLFSK